MTWSEIWETNWSHWGLENLNSTIDLFLLIFLCCSVIFLVCPSNDEFIACPDSSVHSGSDVKSLFKVSNIFKVFINALSLSTSATQYGSLESTYRTGKHYLLSMSTISNMEAVWKRRKQPFLYFILHTYHLLLSLSLSFSTFPTPFSLSLSLALSK